MTFHFENSFFLDERKMREQRRGNILLKHAKNVERYSALAKKTVSYPST